MLFANDHRPSTLHATADDLLPAGDVMDVLLDARNETDSADARAVLDRGLAEIGPRNLVPADEVRAILETLDVMERHVPAPELGRGRLRRRSLLR